MSAARQSSFGRVDEDTEVVGIDEGQFFDADLPAACNALADQGRRVIVAGLDQDYLGRPFEPMPQLLAIAEYITEDALPSAWCAASRRTTPSVWSPTAIASWSGASGHLRGALPALFRPGSVERGRTSSLTFRFLKAIKSSNSQILKFSNRICD